MLLTSQRCYNFPYIPCPVCDDPDEDDHSHSDTRLFKYLRVVLDENGMVSSTCPKLSVTVYATI
jgi:hypothetical protein